MAKLPILIIIPHGGGKVPEELESHVLVDETELFLSSDSCANEIFDFTDKCAGVINTHISKLFVDLNRNQLEIPPRSQDGVIKPLTPYGKNIFEGEQFPDEIAIANILRRYYNPFYDTLEKIMKSGEVRLIVECHTSMGIGLRHTAQADQPLPLATITNRISRDGKTVQTCQDTAAMMILELLKKNLGTSGGPKEEYVLYNHHYHGNLMKHFAKYIPYLRLDISRSFFFDDRYFNFDYMKVDQLRIKELRKRIWAAIEKAYTKCI